jgi:hypothetical protein
MKLAINEQFAVLETIAAVIAHSQIVVVQSVVTRLSAQTAQSRRLPVGFDEMDVAVLDWIAAEGQRAGRSLVRM